MGIDIIKKSQPTFVVIGAGISGLSAAAYLAMRGFPVTILESSTIPGGKISYVRVGEEYVDRCSNLQITPYPCIHELMEWAGYVPHLVPIAHVTYATRNGNTNIWNINQEMGYAIINELHTLEAKVNELYKSLQRAGYRNIDPNTVISVHEFCKQHKIQLLEQLSLKELCAAYGYKTTDTTPMPYFVKLLPYDTMARRFLEGYGYVHRYGYWQVTAALARKLSINYNTHVYEIRQSKSLMHIRTSNKSYTADYVIISTPLHLIDYMDMPSSTSELFSRIYSVLMGRCIVEIEEMSGQHIYIPEARAMGDHIHGILPMYGVPTHMQLTYQMSTPTYEQVMDDMQQFGFHVKKIHDIETFDQFPHVGDAELKTGWFDNVEALQGTNRTFYVHETLSFAAGERCAEYAKHVVDTYISQL